MTPEAVYLNCTIRLFGDRGKHGVQALFKPMGSAEVALFVQQDKTHFSHRKGEAPGRVECELFEKQGNYAHIRIPITGGHRGFRWVDSRTLTRR
jgi:hypothetical protein